MTEQRLADLLAKQLHKTNLQKLYSVMKVQSIKFKHTCYYYYKS